MKNAAALDVRKGSVSGMASFKAKAQKPDVQDKAELDGNFR
jgi:hypothetical protein